MQTPSEEPTSGEIRALEGEKLSEAKALASPKTHLAILKDGADLKISHLEGWSRSKN
jgi:hypothetical protein